MTCKPFYWYLIVIMLALMGTACSESADSTPTSIPLPTPTEPPAQHGNPHLTPIPEPVEETALRAIREQGQLRVGVLYNYPPFGFLSDNGQMHGYEVALISRIAELWGVEPIFVQVTRQTRLPMLIDGEVDMLAAAMPHRRELEQFVEFSDTIFRSGYVVLVPADSGIEEVAMLGTASVAVVGVEAETLFAQAAQRFGISPAVHQYDSVDAAMSAMTEAGSVTAVVGRREELMLAARSAGELEILNEFIAVEPYAFATRRGDTALRDLINLTLQEIAVNDEFGELFSENFYGYAADIFPTYPGDPVYTFDNFPVDRPASEPVLERFGRGEPLRVAGLDLTAEPANFDSQPIFDGYNRAIINEMARRWNVLVVESPQSVGDKGLPLLESGEVDLVVGIRPDRALIGRFALSQPYYQRGLRLIHMRDVTVFGVGDLEYKPSMAAEPLDISKDIIEDNNGFPQISTADSYTAAFEALVNRGVYAVVGDEFALVLMSRADDRIQVVSTRYRPTNYVMALSSTDSDFLALVNFTLQDMQADGTLDLLQQQYFAPYYPEDSDEIEDFSIELWPGDGSYLGVGG
jgi:polar amino acid transport system substrate-binding protein